MDARRRIFIEIHLGYRARSRSRTAVTATSTRFVSLSEQDLDGIPRRAIHYEICLARRPFTSRTLDTFERRPRATRFTPLPQAHANLAPIALSAYILSEHSGTLTRIHNSSMNKRRRGILNNLEYHVLLALAERTLYGYALKEAIEVESRGAVAPRAGSLYRVLARLMSRGLVREAEPDTTVEPHPGLERKYYALTPMGRKALAAEAVRLREAATLAEQRLGLANSAS